MSMYTGNITNTDDVWNPLLVLLCDCQLLPVILLTLQIDHRYLA